MHLNTVPAIAALIAALVAASFGSPIDGPVQRNSPDTLQYLLAESHPPAAAQARLAEFTYGGTGCPRGVGQNTSSDHSFPPFMASIGRGVPLTDSRKNCQVNAEIVANQNWKFRVHGEKAEYLKTRVQLAVGVKATYKDTYYFSGSTAESSIQYDFSGPMSRTRWVADPSEGFTTAWSPCGGGLLNSNRQVRLTTTSTSNVTSTIEYYGEDVNPVLPFSSLEWASCT